MKLEIVSPVHIGTGETKSRMSFFEENGVVYFVDEEYLFKLLNKEQRLNEFTEWIEKEGNDIGEFIKPDERKQLKENPLYSLPCRGKIDKEIQLHIKDARNRFYIPGSSIKGAIRTALLYSILQETTPPLNELMYGKEGTDIVGIMNVLPPNESKKAGLEVEKYVFRAGVYDDERNIIRYNDGKYDLLRFIHFSDGYSQNETFSVIPVRTFSSVRSDLMNVKSFLTDVEAIESGTFTIDLEMDMKSLLFLKKTKEEKSWIGLREKFRKVYGFNLEELSSNNLQDYRDTIIQRILSICSKFANKKRERDLELIEDKKVFVCKKCGTSVDRNNKCWKCKTIRSRNEIQILTLNEIKKEYPIKSEDNSGIIEIGFGSGWKGVTTGIYFNRDTVDKFRRKFKGRWKGKIKKDGSLFWLFPKTIRLAFWTEDSVSYMLPLGWITIAL